ncbi:MAG: hypothetical protein JST84_11550 [Acidobacteria bacterium]|nr:hypothetical protein [Acidobacteriota bacterium]
MNDHLSDPNILLFHARALSPAEMKAALEHLAQCLLCRQRSHEHFQATNAYQASTINLSPAWQFRHEHLDAEQLTALVNQRLDSVDEEVAQAHLQTCHECRCEVQSLRAFQAELKTELRHRYGPKPAPKQVGQWKSWWSAWQWKPVFAATFVAVCVLATILIILNQGKRQTTSPIALASPSATASVINPSPSTSPAASPSATGLVPEETVIASLRDHAGMIAITKTGNLEGIPSVTGELRGDIVAALRTGKLKKPTILNDLAHDVDTVRGKPTDQAATRLLTPVGITVLSNRPLLHWQPVEKAIGYEVEIADGRGNEIARSERLPAATQRWQPPQALPRGTMYTWTVRAIREEPATTALPLTCRFRVLGTMEARELARLKAQANSHLVLGMFYVRVGMLPEAQQEFKALAHQNPDSPLARKLLQTVQAWQ